MNKMTNVVGYGQDVKDYYSIQMVAFVYYQCRLKF